MRIALCIVTLSLFSALIGCEQKPAKPPIPKIDENPKVDLVQPSGPKNHVHDAQDRANKAAEERIPSAPPRSAY